MDQKTHSEIVNDEDTMNLILEHLESADHARDEIARLEAMGMAVNVLFNACSETTGHPDDGDGAGFRRLLQKCIDAESQEALLETAEIRSVVHLRPWIETDRPRSGEDSTAAHKAFVRRWHRWTDQRSNQNRQKALAGLADVLWVVRSNRSHGRKSVTPTRNHDVAKITADSLWRVIESFAGPTTWPRLDRQ